MSSLDFVEITSRGEIPFVAMGHVNVQEVVAAEPPRGARLRVFSHRLPRQPSVSFSLACVFISIVRHMASPDSAVRNYLTHSDCDIARGKHLLFFRAKAGGTERVEPMAAATIVETAEDAGGLCAPLGHGRESELHEVFDELFRGI